MNQQEKSYCLWISWEEQIASIYAVEGYDCLPCCSDENYQTNIRILMQSGFQFQ